MAIIDLSTPNAHPVFYLNDIYEYYNCCGDIYSTANYVVNEVKKTYENLPNINVNLDTIKEKVFFTIVNREQNEELLKSIPYRTVLNDLAVIYRVKISETRNFLLTNKVLSDIPVSEEELYKLAYLNTPNLLGNVCKMDLENWYINELKMILTDTTSFIYDSKIESSEMGEDKIYVFKYKNSNAFGASVILYKDILENTADYVHDNLIITFPSMDELVVTSEKNIEKLAKICENNTIPLHKFLTVNQYKYDWKTKKINLLSTSSLNEEIVKQQKYKSTRRRSK